jgi:hypothetical protein
MFEELGWIIAFAAVFIFTHYQFKYCVPITLWSMKFCQTCIIIIVCKMYVVFRVYGQSIDLAQFKPYIKQFINATRQQYDL